MNQELMVKHIIVFGCGDCPNSIPMTTFGGDNKTLPPGLYIKRCSLTGSDISFGHTPDDCPLPNAQFTP